jgi:tetratricopeptide (TPR) repeat protein
MVEALLGEHETARARATEALATAEALGDFWFTISHRAVLGLLALAEHDPHATAAVLAPAWALMLERRLGDLSLFPVAPVLAEALAQLGRLDETVAIAAALRACPVADQPWCRAMTARCDGLVAAVRRDPAARRAFGTALSAHAEFPEPFEHARATLLLGDLERRARNWGAARAAFGDARERFEQLGATYWAREAAMAVARLPGRRPADPHALTARERETPAGTVEGVEHRDAKCA